MVGAMALTTATAWTMATALTTATAWTMARTTATAWRRAVTCF